MTLILKKIAFFGFLFVAVLFCNGQEIENMMVSPGDQTITIFYDLVGRDTYNISLHYSNDNGSSWKGPLKLVTGDVGENQKEGSRKKIVWDAAGEVVTMEGYFQFKIFVEKISDFPTEKKKQKTITQSPRLTYQEPDKTKDKINKQLTNSKYLKHKRRKNFWLVSTLISGGVGAYTYLEADNKYDEYLNATENEVSELKSQYESLDKAYPIAFGVAGFSLLEFIIQSGKQAKAKNLTLHPIKNQHTTGLKLAYTF